MSLLAIDGEQFRRRLESSVAGIWCGRQHFVRCGVEEAASDTRSPKEPHRNLFDISLDTAEVQRQKRPSASDQRHGGLEPIECTIKAATFSFTDHTRACGSLSFASCKTQDLRLQGVGSYEEVAASLVLETVA